LIGFVNNRRVIDKKISLKLVIQKIELPAIFLYFIMIMKDGKERYSGG